MKLALNGATIMPSPLTDDVEIAAEAKFTALEIWAGKLDAYLQNHTLDDLAHKMRALAIQPWCINSIEDITFRTGSSRRELLEHVERTSAVARAIGAPSIVVVPGRKPDGYNRNECIADAAAVLREMSDAAGDVALAFEFLGKPGCAVPTLEMAIEIVAAVDRPGVGMVIDVFHFYAGGSRLDDIPRVPADKLFVLHLNGCEDHPKPELTDAHRLYPGEGAIPIDAILAAIRARGFDGTASVEIFRPEYWRQDARTVAHNARAGAAVVLERAGFRIDA